MAASPPIIDVDDYLAPISESEPSGASLQYEAEYDEIREARRAEDDTPQGAWARKVKVSDFERVVELGLGLLKRRTKDLQIAAWVSEALTRQAGPGGLRDGLRLLHGIQETFWDSYYPVIEDDEVESRHGPFLFLNKALPAVIRTTMLTSTRDSDNYSFLDWQKSRDLENAIRGKPDYLESMPEVDRRGLVEPEQFAKSVQLTRRAFYETLSADLAEARAAFAALDAGTDARFGRQSPSLVEIRKALDELARPLGPILAQKREAEPDPEPEPEEVEEEPEAEPVEDSTPDEDTDEAPVAPKPKARKVQPRGAGGPIADAADARVRIVEALEYLRKQEPAGSTSFLVSRALRMAELFDAPDPLDPSVLESPSSETRQLLRRLATENEWVELREQAERAIGRPEGRGWLDAHRYAASAMESAPDVDLARPLAGSRAMLKALLAEFPGLASTELADGTPAANAATLSWVEDLIGKPDVEDDAETEAPRREPEPEPEPEPYVPPPRPTSHDDAAAEPEPDAWEQALLLVNRGRVAEGVQLLRRELNAATTGRKKFVLKLQLAEICLRVGNHRVALPLSEELARQVDDFRLEQWEDESLIARVWVALYSCLKASATDPARLKEVFSRLCRLDINLAMSYGDEANS